MPMTAFIGVRISCDMVERNRVFAWLACSAISTARRRFWLMERMYAPSMRKSRKSVPHTSSTMLHSTASGWICEAGM